MFQYNVQTRALFVSIISYILLLVAERQTLSGGQHPLNQLTFDRSGSIVAAACDDGTVKVFDLEGGEDKQGAHAADLRGHEDAVQSVMFEPGPTKDLVRNF